MGQLADIIRDPDLTDVSEELSMLSSLAQAKLDLFKTEIESSLQTGKITDDLTVAITKLIKKHEEYRVVTSSSTKIMDSIGEAVKEIIGGGTVEGITSIINDVVQVFLGAAEGEEKMARDYIVTVEYPAIIRLDFAFWSWRVKNAKLKEKVQSIVCCVVYKSAVDITKLDFNAFLSIYGPTLRASCVNKETKRIKDMNTLKNLLNEAREVYVLLSTDPREKLPDADEIIENMVLS